MKKTNKVKMGPLGTPLGNPLGYFNSLKGKKTEPKQTLRKAQDGIEMNGYGEDSNMMIDKPGYSGGYKKPVSPPPSPRLRPYQEQYDDAIKKYYENGQQSPGSNTTPGQIYGPPPQSKGGSTNRMKKGGLVKKKK